MTEEKRKVVTTRELEFLAWLSNGLTAKEIAREMDISPRTVESYAKLVKYKTNLYRRSQLVAFFKNIR